jgi:integrase
LTERTVNQLITALRAEKEEDAGLSGRWKRDVKNDLKMFSDVFGERMVGAITTEEILTWIRELQKTRGFAWKRRNHLRDMVVGLFLYAQAQGSLPADRITAAEHVPRLKEPKIRKSRSVFTPNEMRAWIANIKPRYRPWLLICGFSSVRSEEVAPDPDSHKDPLRWEDIKWKKAKPYIHVRRETSKVNEDRNVPMPENLIAFLEEYRDRTGVICPGEQPSKRETSRLGKIACAEIDGRVVPIKWRKNALRHTVISARLAIVKKRAQVAEEAGTSEKKIRTNYNEGMDEEDAAAWFAIMPKGRAQNLLPFTYEEKAS